MMPKKKTHETFVKEIRLKYGDEYKVLGTYQSAHTPIMMRHNICGNEWNTTSPYDLLKQKPNRCPKCATHQSWKSSMSELQNDMNILYGTGIFTVSGEYVNNKTVVDVKHNACGNVHKCIPNRLRSGKYNCKYCNNKESVVSSNVESTLLKFGLKFEKEKTFEWLIYENALYIDFFLTDFNVAVEADGEQHYVVKRGGETEFLTTMKRDKRKAELCAKNGIVLIRVPSYLPKHPLIPFLTKLLYEANVLDFDEE